MGSTFIAGADIPCNRQLGISGAVQLTGTIEHYVLTEGGSCRFGEIQIHSITQAQAIAENAAGGRKLPGFDIGGSRE